MMKWKLSLFTLALALVGATATAAPLTTCGMVRDDLKVCVTSWALPDGSAGTYLSLRYSNGESYSLTPQVRQNAEGQGVSWYWGPTTVRGTWMDLWLRVDWRPTYLPVYPGLPATAQLYYRTVPGSTWIAVPGRGSFPFTISQ